MSITYDDFRHGLTRLSDLRGDWEGIPVPIPDMPVRLYKGHRMADVFRGIDGVDMPLIVGGPNLEDDEDDVLVNHWVSRARQVEVYVFHRLPSRRAFVVTIRVSPDRSMDRLTLWLKTLGASDAWGEEAETKAQEKLRGMLSPRQWRHYHLTGTFMETSPRSRITYVFRRGRPTIAMTPRWREREGRPDPDTMRCLAVLCLHPVGYYDRTWAGCMVPSDDVIAHLLLMRADEAGYWKQANQHNLASPEAGL